MTALAVANTLAGNPACTAAIEILGAGLRFKVEADAVTLALSGAAAVLALENEKARARVPPFRSVVARRNDVVHASPSSGGAPSYLAVAGGFDLVPALGSMSTYRRAALGGFNGRALAAGDFLPLRLSDREREPVQMEVSLPPPHTLRVMLGPEDTAFQPAALEALLSSSSEVSPASDRMGLRLAGASLARISDEELSSRATTGGALQVPSHGQPILLLADRQTTGGYPRIATVIGADLSAAGRLAAGMVVRFQQVDRQQAIHALAEHRKWLESLPTLIRPAPTAELTPERLLGQNLIGGVTTGSGCI
jgi:biotin-dependent carboxylase-like uncharacterized protein